MKPCGCLQTIMHDMQLYSNYTTKFNLSKCVKFAEQYIQLKTKKMKHS